MGDDNRAFILSNHLDFDKKRVSRLCGEMPEEVFHGGNSLPEVCGEMVIIDVDNLRCYGEVITSYLRDNQNGKLAILTPIHDMQVDSIMRECISMQSRPYDRIHVIEYSSESRNFCHCNLREIMRRYLGI